ncbi:hypothetical protein [Actimicrobium antarcticum]|uniref:Uncharacterized protein n=1 Tax=Actimicrobium antarcticum TaxID=1051899 RepID=A0ABP7T5K9_9BURK
MTTSTCHAIVRNVRAPEGHIRIEGSAAFVQAELARYDQPCFEVVTDSSTERLPRLSEPVAERQRQVGRIEQALERLAHLPHSNMAHKTISAALLIGYVDTLMGAPTTPLWRIRDMVKHLGCHDTNNFSAVLRRETALFSHSGEPTLALNPAGFERADELVRQLLLA